MEAYTLDSILWVTCRYKFLMWFPQQPLWATVSSASQGLLLVHPLDKVPIGLTRAPHFWFELTNQVLARNPKETLIKMCAPGPAIFSCCILPWPPVWPLEEYHVPPDLWIINFSISISPAIFDWAQHLAHCTPLKCYFNKVITGGIRGSLAVSQDFHIHFLTMRPPPPPLQCLWKMCGEQ